jgi:hypothetical protein
MHWNVPRSVAMNTTNRTGCHVDFEALQLAVITSIVIDGKRVRVSCAWHTGCHRLVKESERTIELPILLHMDNQVATVNIMNEANSSKTKHIDIQHEFINDLYRQNIILASYATTTNMKVDILTKIMSGPNFVRLRSLWDQRSSSPRRCGALNRIVHFRIEHKIFGRPF